MSTDFRRYFAHPQPTRERPLLGSTVLLVEDSRFASEAIRLLCLHSGARIRRADSLAAARRHLAVYRPTIVIVDMGLPDGSGADLLADLAGAVPRVPVLMGLSGDPGGEAAAMKAGADGFLAKPVESVALFQQALLRHLPAGERMRGPRLVSDDRVSPDPVALADDLDHVAEIMRAKNTGALDYVAQFLGGVARSAHDAVLEEAAENLRRAQRAGRTAACDIARLREIVEERLASARAV